MKLRFAETDDDVAGIQEIYADIVERTAISFESAVPGHLEIARRVAEVMPTYPWLVAADDARVLGYAYGHRFGERAAYAWSVETSIYVRDNARGQGVGTKLYAALFALLAAQGYQQALAGITLPNDASVGLHESVGFERAATYRAVGFKFGEWRDVGWWQRGLQATPDPAPPTPVGVDAL
ncbi:MAG TPA: arsinothricin resistance N-acetyltransferase ArsN1 family B, partial [Acidimicrobiia bacterium]|nr:arsinothricin resistance N-acetyltransferase ArsN1 family B [Acidimicrobiia bacterium]